jgi:hypothetical protein
MSGTGRFTFASGAVYEGGFVAGTYGGEGTYTWPDGWRYEVGNGSCMQDPLPLLLEPGLMVCVTGRRCGAKPTPE